MPRFDRCSRPRPVVIAKVDIQNACGALEAIQQMRWLYTPSLGHDVRAEVSGVDQVEADRGSSSTPALRIQPEWRSQPIPQRAVNAQILGKQDLRASGELGHKPTVLVTIGRAVGTVAAFLQALPVDDSDVGSSMRDQPLRSSSCIAVVTPERRTPSMMDKNSCVSGISSPSTRSCAISNHRANRSSILLRPLARAV